MLGLLIVIIPFLIFLTVFVLVQLIYGILFLKISDKMGISDGSRFFGFFPFLSEWLLGKLAQVDEELYPFEKKKWNWKVICLLCSVSGLVLALILGVLNLLSIIPFIGLIFSLISIFLGLFGVLVSWVCNILTCLARFKIYRKLAGNDAPWMLVLSLCLFPSIGTFIVFLLLAFGKKYKLPSNHSPSDRENAKTVPAFEQQSP